jgi:Ca-activated chloride channel homolog
MKKFVTVLAAILAMAIPTSFTEAQTTQSDAPATMLVFDVSNSMWGQIDGVSKVEIARDVIGDLLSDWNPNVELGLVAYGHRRQSDCGDIETVIPVGPVNAESFSRTVNSLVPRGRTPLTDAVRIAATELGYTDRPSTIILVSDGIESCNADPCALATELERNGIGFTAHVVGFDVAAIEDQRQLSCLAENTGGMYLTASNADELSQALRTVAAPRPAMLRLEVAEAADGPALSDPSTIWTVVALDTEDTLVAEQAAASLELDADAGRFFARAELGDRIGSVEFTYADDDMVQRIVLEAPVVLNAPDLVEALTDFAVDWQGPNGAGDFIALAQLGSAAVAFEAYTRTTQGSPATITATAIPGDYVLRYVDAARSRVLAERPIEIVAPFATLAGPESVRAGADFEVSWTGPDANGDYILIAAVGSEDQAGGNYVYTRQGDPAGLRAPDETGQYELRYFNVQVQRVIARQPIEVLPVSASLEAVPAAPAGSDVKVVWTGPDNANDYVAVVAAGADQGTYINYSYTRQGSPATIRLPDESGAYELRYVLGQSQSTLASLPISATGISATLEAPPAAPAGSEVKVVWTGPDNKNDFVAISQAGDEENKYTNYAYTRDGSPSKVRMPDDAGAYELRYYSGQSRSVLVSLPITVTVVTATLEAPPSAPAGSEIKVVWTGPDNKNDFVAISQAGDEENKYSNYAYTRDGSPSKVRMPDDAGAYELRYYSGQSRSVLVSLPITVIEVTATLEAPPVAPAGSEVKVVWTGPDNKNDFIAIAEAGAEEGKYLKYAYTRDGSPAKIKTPESPGSYELRYFMGQSRKVLVSLPLTVN